MDARVFERGVVLFAGRRPAEAGEVPRSLQSFQAAQFVGRSNTGGVRAANSSAPLAICRSNGSRSPAVAPLVPTCIRRFSCSALGSARPSGPKSSQQYV